jgi:hypothetical protein
MTGQSRLASQHRKAGRVAGSAAGSAARAAAGAHRMEQCARSCRERHVVAGQQPAPVEQHQRRHGSPCACVEHDARQVAESAAATESRTPGRIS